MISLHLTHPRHSSFSISTHVSSSKHRSASSLPSSQHFQVSSLLTFLILVFLSSSWLSVLGQLAPPNGEPPTSILDSTGPGSIYNGGDYNPLPTSTGGNGDGELFGNNFPDQPPGNITYLPNQCQFVSKWSGPRCPAGYECVSDALARQVQDGKIHLSYRQSQCVFCAVTEFCTDEQKDECKRLDVLSDTATLEIVNQTFGIGECMKCKEGQYCPAETINPFGLAIVNLCEEGHYCPNAAQQLVCPIGFYCPPGTKYPFACTILGTYCPENSTSPEDLCPGGSYCPDPQTQIRCPSGYFCKAGSIAPKKCQALASCPAGSAAALLFWQGIIFVILIYVALAAVYYAILFIQRRRRKKELEDIAHRAEGAEVVQLLKSLKSFQNLERQASCANGRSTECLDEAAEYEAAFAAAGVAPVAGLASARSQRPCDVEKTKSLGYEYELAKTTHDDLAIVKKIWKKEDGHHGHHGEGSQKEDVEEIVGVISDPNKPGGAGPATTRESVQHERVAVILPSAHSETELTQPNGGQHLGRHNTMETMVNGTCVTAARSIPTSVDVKTDHDLDGLAAAKAALESEEEDESEFGDDELTGFDPIPVPISLQFEKLGLKLKDGTEILKGVSGVIPHSMLTAVMGPSGAGKSTFLNVLCGKATYGKQTGSVSLNGIETPIQTVKSVMGFVPQEDVMHSDLTCYENLYYNAMLRLPRTMPYAQKKQIIQDTIKMLGLEAIQHSVVGSVEKRGISGGQRKRVNIGMEVVAWPSLLFMDEPTSGLDSTASLEVLSALRDLTELGVNVIMVIHQPRFSIVELFHQMLLLGKGGQTVFLGNSAQALNYFSDLGFNLPPNENPADFFLDVISGEVRRDNDPDFQPGDLYDLWEAMGEWVRRGELEPPCDENEEEEGTPSTVKPQRNPEKSPSKGFLSPPGLTTGNAVRSPASDTGPQRSAPPTLNVMTPSHMYQHQFYRNNPGSRGTWHGYGYGNARTPYTPFMTPYEYNTNRHATPFQPAPLQRSATLGGPGIVSLLLPAQGIINQRSQTVGSQQGTASVSRSPARSGPYFYPYSSTNSHKRTKSQYQILNAYRAGVTNAADLPLPKHRELLNKIGKDNIGKLVEEYQEYQHPNSKGKGFSLFKGNKSQTPKSHGGSTPAAASTMRSPPSRKSPHASRPPLMKSSSVRRLNMLFDRNGSARNLHGPGSTKNANNPLARPLHRQSTHHQLGQLGARPSPKLSAPAIVVNSPELSPDEEWEPEANERTPLTPGDRDHALESDVWKKKTPPISSSSAPASTQRNHHQRQSSSLDGIQEMDEGDEPQPMSGALRRSPAAPQKTLNSSNTLSPKVVGASPRRDRSPSSRSQRVRFHEDESPPEADLQDVELHEPPSPVLLPPSLALHMSPQRQGYTEEQAPVVRSSSLPTVATHSQHGRSKSGGYHPALASIPSEGELDSGRASQSPESTDSEKLAAALRTEAGGDGAQCANGSPPSNAELKRKPTISVLSPALRPRAASPLDVISKANAVATDAVALKMKDEMGVLPRPRQTPHIHVQFLYLLQRQGLKQMRGINDVVFDMSLTTAVGLAIGLIFGGVWSLNGYATISTMAVLSLGVLSAVSALKMFGHDRVVFWREASSGISITAYWLAVTLLHIPLNIMLSFLFVAPYWNLILPDVPFLDTWWVFIAVYFACSGGGMLLSVIFSPIPALLCGVMIPLIIGGFLNGVSPALRDMGAVMTFLCDISYSRYGVEALMIQQLQVQPDYADSLVNDIFDEIGFVQSHLDFAIGMLFIIGLLLRFGTLIALHTANRKKRV